MTTPIRSALTRTSLAILTAGAATVTQAQITATVTVNPSQVLATIPATEIGLDAAVWDSYMNDSNMPGLFNDIGVSVYRYPGGSYSDFYHWATNSITTGISAYIAPNTNFDDFMVTSNAAGTRPLITINYGSNAAGTAGGDPNEAAAWVKYANVTKAYGVKYWEIGNEIYGNGFYGTDWETDLHAPANGSRQGNSLLGPTAYGQNVLTYISAMKAVDPTIKVGAVLATPLNWPEGISPDWNVNVLQACGSQIDFVILHWYPNPSTAAELLASTANISSMVADTQAQVNAYCGSNAPNVQIFVTEGDTNGFGCQNVGALWAADDFMKWLSSGVTTVDWWDQHNGASVVNGALDDEGLFSNGTSAGGFTEPAVDAPFPPYYGLELVHLLGQPRASIVNATSNNSSLIVHATQALGEGPVGIMLINENPTESAQVTITVNNVSPRGTAHRYDYGPNSTGLTTSTFPLATATFTVTVPAYTISDFILPTGPGGLQNSGNPVVGTPVHPIVPHS